MLALSAVAYQQPITRAGLSRLVGHEISRDILGRLKSAGVIAPGSRAPMPGAPIAWVTTQRFLEMFALGSLRDLPDLGVLDDPSVGEAEGTVEAAIDDALGLSDEVGVKAEDGV
jgi:segregation and condensation protein B